MSGKPIDEVVVTDALIADLLPAALIFAENEEHLAHARQRAKTILLETLTAAQQQGQAVAWGGWATQYPGKMPKLYGAEEIARLNWHPSEGQDLIRVVEVDRVTSEQWLAAAPSAQGARE